MESIAEELVREILLKLPTRDVLRGRCVSRQWRSLLADPSFVDLHVDASHVVSGSGAEVLVVTETRDMLNDGLEMAVLDGSSGKPMCRVTDLPARYRPVNACNGFLLLAPGVKNMPVYVCNPVSGEKQKILPPLETEDIYRRTYAMGFSSTAGQYKLFRLCFQDSGGWPETWENYMEVYTLGDKGGGSWRRHPDTFTDCAVDHVHQQSPVLLDGRIYVLTERAENGIMPEPDRMLVIDVASESHCTYCLPERFIGEVMATVHAFELGGLLCVARRVVRRQILHFWVMEPLRPGQPLDHKKGRSLYGTWELRYTFYIDECGDGLDAWWSAAWLDTRDGMLCYRLGECLYRYDTTKVKEQRKKKEEVHDFSEWDLRIQLPLAPSAGDQRWNVYGGYRPNLLSPHNLVSRRNDNEQEQYEQALVHALRCKQSSKKRCSIYVPTRSQ